MGVEGELTVRLDWNGRRVRRTTVHSTRPFAASRLLVGRAPAAAAATVPRLFSICAQAQGAAAAGAVGAAAGVAPEAATATARAGAVRLETIQEHLWRVLLDWPQAMGVAGDSAAVASARRVIAPVLTRIAAVAQRIDDGRAASEATIPHELERALVALAARHVYGMAPAAWLTLADADSLARWTATGPQLPARLLARMSARWPRLGASDVALMPEPTPESLRAKLVPAMRGDGAFEQLPTWDDGPRETGALARMRAHPLVAAVRSREGNTAYARMVARLAELALALGRIGRPQDDDEKASADAFGLAPGEGLAAVQSARGLLLHRVETAEGRVTRYQIVAPTEWNFHPGGALVRGFDDAEAPDEPSLVTSARLAVQALDPCVACRIEVRHA